MKLIKAEQFCFFGYFFGDRLDGIAIPRLAPTVYTLMHIEHKSVEVNAFLGFDRCVFKEPIHEHGFTAPHTAP